VCSRPTNGDLQPQSLLLASRLSCPFPLRTWGGFVSSGRERLQVGIREERKSAGHTVKSSTSSSLIRSPFQQTDSFTSPQAYPTQTAASHSTPPDLASGSVYAASGVRSAVDTTCFTDGWSALVSRAAYCLFYARFIRAGVETSIGQGDRRPNYGTVSAEGACV